MRRFACDFDDFFGWLTEDREPAMAMWFAFDRHVPSNTELDDWISEMINRYCSDRGLVGQFPGDVPARFAAYHRRALRSFADALPELEKQIEEEEKERADS